jgi:hypothetical protein
VTIAVKESRAVRTIDITGLTEEQAGVLKSVMYRFNWGTDQWAEQVLDALDELGVNSVDVSYDVDSQEFIRA